MELKHQKAKKQQKIFATVLGIIVMGVTIVAFVYGQVSTSWLFMAAVYDVVVIVVIFSELIDETWVTTRIRESELVRRIELSNYESLTIDIIS